MQASTVLETKERTLVRIERAVILAASLALGGAVCLAAWTWIISSAITLID